MYSTSGIGPLPTKVKCPTCGEAATISSHNHVMKDEHGLEVPLWMPMGWYCKNCSRIFCQLCTTGKVEVI